MKPDYSHKFNNPKRQDVLLQVSQSKDVGAAEISACGNYRFWLYRTWGPGPECGLIGLNPSTATSTRDDPTTKKCILMAKKLGFFSIWLFNLYAWRASNPRELDQVENPVGDLNQLWLKRAIKSSLPIVICWGNRGIQAPLEKTISLEKRELWCFGKTKLGAPRHPLYLPLNTKVSLWDHRLIESTCLSDSL